MEILMLVLLYYLSQNPDFAESVKPLMGQLKNSQQMLAFLNDLSKFNETFSTIKNSSVPKEDEKKEAPPKQENKPPKEEQKKEEPPKSPTVGIADDFIQQILEGYLKR